MTRQSKHPWTKDELKVLHARYMAGEYPSELAKIRGRKSEYLLERFRHFGWPLRARATGGRARRLPEDLIMAMYADYQTGMSFSAVERKYGRGVGTARVNFKTRGLAMRVDALSYRHHKADGTWVALPPKTPEELEAIIQAATSISIPADLVTEWRAWDLPRRAEFIRRLRDHLQDPGARPDTPFSEGLVPFDYGTEEAWEIMRSHNHGLDSQHWNVKFDLRSQGVIYQGRLWFWSRTAGPAYFSGPWRPGQPRVALHRHIWAEANGRPVPPQHVVCIADGNLNNLDPANLVLRSRNDLCRENQARTLTARSRAKTSALLTLSQTNKKDPNEHLVLHLKSHQ